MGMRCKWGRTCGVGENLTRDCSSNLGYECQCVQYARIRQGGVYGERGKRLKRRLELGYGAWDANVGFGVYCVCS